MLRFRLKGCFVNVATTCSVAMTSSHSQACPYPEDLDPGPGTGTIAVSARQEVSIMHHSKTSQI